MPLVKLDIPAGVYSHGVDLDSKGRWLDSSLVRWTNNAPQPVGGWAEFSNIEDLLEYGNLEDATPWTVTNGTLDTASGAVSFDTDPPVSGSIYQDISAILEPNTDYIIEITVDSFDSGYIYPTVGGADNPFSPIRADNFNESTTYTKTLTTLATPNLQTGVSVSANTTCSISRILVRKKDRQSRGMHAWVTNNGAPWLVAGSYDRLAAMNGNGVVYDITPASFSDGVAAAQENLGYGGKNYGSGAYGVARERNFTLAPATNWTLDNWGQNLVACSDDAGFLYEWVFDSTGTPEAQAKIVNTSNGYTESAPTGLSAIVVTAERFVFCLGTGDSNRQVKWSDRENIGVWTPATTNEAGDIELQTSGKIMAGARVRGRTLIVTTEDAWVATYQGPPTVYGFQKIGNSCGLAGRNMLASVGPTAFWMGERNFFYYDGSTARVLPCEVHDRVFTEMDRDRISQGFCVANQRFNEVWWFYPGTDFPASIKFKNEVTRYVAYDYNENHWMIGSIYRCAASDAGAFADPMWIGLDGTVYRHETGYGHSYQSVFLESGPINIADGDNVMRVTEMIPEEETQGEVQVKFKTRFYPNGDETEHGPFDPANPINVRMTGRQLRVRVEREPFTETNWRFGDVRLRISSGGRR
jgi:hypothetical protein